ncbi:MAG TPA: hypothetical protein VFV94_21745, partial [Polyangiaceae bacterium]|nr:hypothetical protein [Polyangiaceae bacterium]
MPTDPKRKRKTVAAKSSARGTVSGPARGRGAAHDAAELGDMAAKKLDGADAVARSMPFNVNKAGEHGRAAMDPQSGQVVAPPDPAVTGSTLTETTASDKVGSGRPARSQNPGNLPLDRVRTDA